jgi:CHAD domain-containing protein
MKQTRHECATPAAATVSDVRKYLANSLGTHWRRYRKCLKRCQDCFSEEAVHDSRVETRRLLATIELLRAFIAKDEIKKVRRTLKNHLDTFDQLRDTQVQLVYVGRLARAFPAARAFRSWLQQRERRFTRATRKAIKHIKTKRLGRRIARVRADIFHQRKLTPGGRAFATALREIDRAFALVGQRCRRATASDTATIHRTRIAFRRFRYMVEALSPMLPAVSEQHRRALHGYQSMMGDIQDVEVLLAALDKFLRSGEVGGEPAKQLHGELVRRRRILIKVYLNAAGRLRRFWPVGGAERPVAGERPKHKLR